MRIETLPDGYPNVCIMKKSKKKNRRLGREWVRGGTGNRCDVLTVITTTTTITIVIIITLITTRVLHGRRSPGIPEQRVKAPGDVVGLHAVELLVDDRHQRGGAQDQQH